MPVIFTVGHSNLAFADFRGRLLAHGVQVLADVRASPWSRRHPQFNREALEAALGQAGLRYRWLGEALGGLRQAPQDSPHAALAEPAFQAYATHMESEAFQATLERVCHGATRLGIALMCAEASPTHCHRQFIADALTLRGLEVRHILDSATAAPHVLHPALRVVDTALRYDRHVQDGLFGGGQCA